MNPCPACNRHVHPGIACVFCGAKLEAQPERVEPSERLGRAARAAIGITAVAAVAAAAAAACGGDAGSSNTVKNPTADPDGGPVQVEDFQRHQGGGGQNMPYGAPPMNGVAKRVV
jgi:hypothetical protein